MKWHLDNSIHHNEPRWIQDVDANQIELLDLFTVEQMAARWPKILSQMTLRYQLRNREKNGLSMAVVRIGKRVLISEKRYQQWLAENADAAAEIVR